MAKVMVEVKQVDLKTFRTNVRYTGAYCTTLGTCQRLSRHTSWVRNGTLM